MRIVKIIQRELSKKDITSYVRYQRWYLKNEDTQEVLIMVDENFKNKNNELVNKIKYKENFALLCTDNQEYSNEFYTAHKVYKPRLFIMNNSGVKYNEYDVQDWELTEDGIHVAFK